MDTAEAAVRALSGRVSCRRQRRPSAPLGGARPQRRCKATAHTEENYLFCLVEQVRAGRTSKWEFKQIEDLLGVWMASMGYNLRAGHRTVMMKLSKQALWIRQLWSSRGVSA